MEENYIKEVKIKDKSEEEKDKEILYSIMTTRRNLAEAHKNFEYAEGELIDYYSYNIKANQAKLDYLIKMAKARGLLMDYEVQNNFDLFQNVS